MACWTTTGGYRPGPGPRWGRIAECGEDPITGGQIAKAMVGYRVILLSKQYDHGLRKTLFSVWRRGSRA